MDIKLTGINYRFGADGSTESVAVTYSAFDTTGNTVSATAVISTGTLKDGKSLDDLTKHDLETVAKATIADWFDEQEATATSDAPEATSAAPDSAATAS